MASATWSVSGLPAGVTPQKDWVTGVVLHSDLPTTGTFASSSAKLNQLQSNITWGWRSNSVDIPTDCPQRDERMGWTGDAEVFCATAMLNTDALAFWKSWLQSMREEQEADGAIPDIVPNASKGFKARSPGWMDAATVIPWEVYVRTGDASVLAENFEMMEKLVGWYRAQSVDGLLPKIGGYGDWLQPYPQQKAKNWMGYRRGDTPVSLLGGAFYARSARILADSARVLGRSDEAKRYGEEADTVRAAFVKAYFDTEGKLQNAPETQTAYVLAIAFDLLPPELKAKAGENLVRLVKAADDHLRTGFLGTPFIAQALDETGHSDVAATLLFQETYPSWFYPINQGATTMWERWNSYTRDKGFGDVEMNSFNHYAYGAIGQWMVERVAGLAPDPAQAGYRHFFIRPLVSPQLDSARATLKTPYGTASSAWTKKAGEIAMDIVVPPNATATVQLPDQSAPQTVSAGKYHFVTKLK
ncbi:MAG: alpha-L-rhamnosidase C-terminal domain-containing protein [Chthoniobacteraceae bacterium]